MGLSVGDTAEAVSESSSAMRSNRSMGGKKRLCLSSLDEPTNVIVICFGQLGLRMLPAGEQWSGVMQSQRYIEFGSGAVSRDRIR